MRGLSIRLHYLGMCDIFVDHNKVKNLLYYAVLWISDWNILNMVWYLGLAIADPPR